MTAKELKLSPYEQLLYTMVRIEMLNANYDVIGYGTAFYFNFADGKGILPALVTNKHVVEDADFLKFHLHAADKDGFPNGKKVTAVIPKLVPATVIYHPEADVDWALIHATVVERSLIERGKPYFRTFGSSEYIIQGDRWSDIGVVEDIVMVGYPNALIDNVHNSPIFRKGITATLPRLDFQGRPEFVIDCACFPGSSGSPVFIINKEARFSDEQGHYPALLLAGVLYAGPQFGIEGEVRVVTSQQSAMIVADSEIPMNLGYVVKADKLLDFYATIASTNQTYEDLVNNELGETTSMTVYTITESERND